jgi:3-hydroxy-3-methylglutaryl CoA synthase
VSGITGYASYVPYYRLARKALGGGRGERAVASYDEDAASMAVEAAREALRGTDAVDTLLLATTAPPYAEKLNAATVLAGCGLPETVRTLDVSGSTRAGVSALLSADDVARAGGTALACASDVMVGAPGGSRERDGGDAAAAFLFGDDEQAIARVIGRASCTTELLDVWRLPEDRFVRQWEERFGAEVLGPALVDTARRALAAAGIEASALAGAIVDCTNARAAASLPRAIGLAPDRVADPLADSVGRAGAAHAPLLLARALDRAEPGDRLLVLSCADGCDALVLQVTPRIAQGRARRPVDRWIASGNNRLDYLTYLKWRGVLPFEPPRRPDPERPAAPPMRRAENWKLAFVGSRCEKCGAGHLPPQRVCVACGTVDCMRAEPFADAPCKVATFTIDRLAYTLQPPVVAAVVDYQGGGRFQCELTDVDPKDVAIGNELEMTFRRLFTAGGVHNYFWKARPLR